MIKTDTYMFNMYEIEVSEKSEDGLCIWCEQPNKKNIAHIFSKNLLKSNKRQNTLKKSVCATCNTFFGNTIEDWFFKYSPIATWKNQIFLNKKILTNLKNVPNFVWLDYLDEWVVINHDSVADILATQLILSKDKTLKFIHFDKSMQLNESEISAIYNKILSDFEKNIHTYYITESLPDFFSPRLILYKNSVIFIGRDEADEKELKDVIKSKKDVTGKTERFAIENIKKMVINYSWSIQKYNKWAGKIGFEFLHLLEGGKFCLQDNFIDFKKQLLDKSASFDKLSISSYEGKGLKVKRLTMPGWVGFVELNNKNLILPVLQTPSTNCHKVFIYEIDGYLVCCMTLFNIEPCQIIIAKDVSLTSIYYIEYDFINDKLNFYVGSKKMEEKPSSDFSKVLDYVKQSSYSIFGTFDMPSNSEFPFNRYKQNR